ncbi:MAG: hypothetical protein COS49_01705 [Candidatus Portnoybacteria bacterium CG03_land_8_20_14_0_80_41_10]|uniref:Uncharacterized protein n=1 Tax=Candidatus Portnoybacteria bacterium CG03_land_8_20_14_0_80_41_10 TaxID=1974808 RepID=A0A2M7BUI2_9BACT|nr:MAG: hypothetical protein COS49_01705 [Candidatus Portnoybacteria bacterium CG03_land_8_20_14_0_80_41_10]
MKPVANVIPILVLIVPTTMAKFVVTKEFVIAVLWKDQFGVVLTGDALVLANMILLVRKGGNPMAILR